MVNPLKKYETQAENAEEKEGLTGEMPTVTTLLQRKKLQLASQQDPQLPGVPREVSSPIPSSTSQESPQAGAQKEVSAQPALVLESPPSPAPVASGGTEGIVIELDIPATAPPVETPPQEQLVISSINSESLKSRMERRGQFRMIRWSKELLQDTPGPFARALEILNSLGGVEIIYFETQDEDNEWHPLAAYAERDRMACWTGLSVELPQDLEKVVKFSQQTQGVVSMDTNGDWKDHWRRHLILTGEMRVFLIPISPLPVSLMGRHSAEPSSAKRAFLSVHTTALRFDRICKSIQPLLASIESG